MIGCAIINIICIFLYIFSNEIWCKAVMKDSWTEMDPNSPQSTIQQLIFFRLVELCMLGKNDECITACVSFILKQSK